MSDFATRLKIAIARKGIKPSVLAYKCGVNQSTISNYLKSRYIPKTEMILKLCDALDADPEWLSGYISPAFARKSNEPVKIPVLGYVAAGVPIEAITDILDYEEIDADMLRGGAEYFALKIKGDSMEPRIYDGDVVIVQKQTTVDSGQIAIVCVNGDHATCKKILKQQSGVLLQPLNPTHTAAFYTNDEIESLPITIIGRVVELRGKL